MDVKYSIENKRRLSTLRNSIKSRPSQYISLIIGIILSITFLSIIVLLVTSIPSTLRAYFYTQMGNAELIVLDTTPSKMDQYLSQGTVTEYGLGEAWAKVNVGTDENLFVGKLDNKSQKYLNLQ